MNPAVMVLDVSDMPLWRRLPSILRALDALAEGSAIDLVVDLDPWPLKDHLEHTRAGRFEWCVMDDGPERWRVRVQRLGKT